MKTHSKSAFNIFTLFALLASLLGSAVFVTPAYAATVTVTDCGDSGAPGQLRTLMNAAASGDTINIPACTIAITGAAGDDANVSGDLDFTKSLTLVGAGAGSTIIDDDALDRVFHVTGAFTVNISGVTVRNGNAVGAGGGLLNDGGTLTITNSTFSGNSASGNDGGGVYNAGTLTITNSTFSGNSAEAGGGVYNANAGTLTITNSTFSGNSATQYGGGIRNNGTLTIANSTFSGNSATLYGGGLSNNNGTSTIANSTFSGNSAAINGGGIKHVGGTVTLKNTIVANSTAGGDCAGPFAVTDGGNNIVEDNTCGFTGGVDPNLGALTGSPAYFPLNTGSAAIDAGNNTVCAAAPVNNESQNSVTRPVDGDGNGTAICDIGSYEKPDTSAPTVVSNTIVTSYTTGPSSFTVTFSENVYDPAGNTDPDDVTNPANYLLVEDGANGTFNTVSCAGGLVADDMKVTVTSVTYIPNTSIINFGSALPAGTYRLFVCGTTSIVDLALNPLNGGTDTFFNFVVASATTIASSLPKTGFAPNKVTSLPAQPANAAYADLGSIWLEIPSQNIKANIVGVPQTNSGWDVTWLGNDIGWLNGTAFPTWTGNSVLTGHVWNADNTPGVFVNLKQLQYGDHIKVHAFGQVYTYEVRESRTVWPSQVNIVLQHEDKSYLTLLTCEDYHILWGTYSVRRMTRAVLVDVK